MKYQLNDLIISKNQGVNTTVEKIKYSKIGHIVLRAKNILEDRLDLLDVVYIDDNTYNCSNDSFKPHIDDILYTNIGSQFGNACVLKNNEYYITWNILRLVPNKKLIYPKYLAYLLNYNKERLRSLNSSSTMPFVSGAILCQQEFDIHNLNEQQHIVDTIGSIDDLIEKYQLILDKQTLFERNLIKKENNVNTTKLKENIKFVKGKKPTKMLESGVKYLSIDVLDGSTELFANPEKTIIANNNDVLMVMDGASSGKVYIGNEGIVGSTLSRIDTSNINSYYLYLFLKNNYSFISEHNTGSAIPHTNKELVLDLDIPISKFSDKLYNNFLNSRIQINKIIKKLNKLKQLYLKKFFG